MADGERKSGINYAALTVSDLELALEGWSTAAEELKALVKSAEKKRDTAILQARRLRTELKKRVEEAKT
jgi:hypothetical protein